MKKQYWFIIIAIIVIAAIATGLILWLGSNRGPEPAKPQALSYIRVDNKYYPILNGQRNGDPITIYHKSYTDDGSVACVLTNDDELILFTLSGRETIANNVDRFTLHRDGSAVTYSTNDCVLYRYDVGTGNTQTLLNGFKDYLISVENQFIAYINSSNALILKTGDTEKQIAILDPYSSLSGLSDNAAHIHVESRQNGETVLSSYDAAGQRTEILRSQNNDLYPQYGSMSQLLISPIDGPAYISINSQPAVKISDSWVEPVFSVDDTESPNGLQNWPYYTAAGELWYIGDDPLNPTILVEDAKAPKCDLTGRYVWYVKDNNLMLLDVLNGAEAEEKAVVIMEDLLDLTMVPPTGANYRDMLYISVRYSSDCQKLYYRDDDSLYLVDAMKGGEKVLIADIKDGFAILDNGIVFYTVDSVLYSYFNGKSTELQTGVESLSIADPYHICAKLGDSYYISDGISSYTLTLSSTG